MKRSIKWIVPRSAPRDDPRIAIARHIAWIKPITPDTEYSLPEPDHYNYCGLATRPIDCEFIADQVFYQDKKTGLWWSIYYVTEENNDAFLAWSESIEFIQCWTPFRQTKMRTRRGMLWARHNISEGNQTDNERLYTMGYYEKLKSKYFDDDEKFIKVVGTPRGAVLNYQPEVDSYDDSTLEES